MERIIRKTKSICPVCLETLNAQVIQKSKGVFLVKSCQKHGKYEILLSRDPVNYGELDKFYFNVMDNRNDVSEYEIWPTLRCNTECSICCFGNDSVMAETADPDIIEIERFVKNDKKRFYILSGGEPTCREDIEEVIRIIKKYDKTATMNTNGLKMTDIKYAEKLKHAGLDRVNLQFDGFKRESYCKIRGKDLLDIKLKIVENLKQLDMPVTFNATIVRGVNDDDILELINFGVRNSFISSINFFTICYTGGARRWKKENYIMPDEIISITDDTTGGIINKQDVFVFQKLHLAIKSIFKQKYCLYNQVYLLVRCKNSYKPIGGYFSLSKADPWLNRYERAFKTNKIMAAVYLGIALISMSFNVHSIFILWRLLKSAWSYFFKSSGYLHNRLFLLLSFSTGCDPYKLDLSILENCQNEIIAPDGKSGKLAHAGSDGRYCINIEKKFLSEQKSTKV